MKKLIPLLLVVGAGAALVAYKLHKDKKTQIVPLDDDLEYDDEIILNDDTDIVIENNEVGNDVEEIVDEVKTEVEEVVSELNEVKEECTCDDDCDCTCDDNCNCDCTCEEEKKTEVA